ncbi:MAG: hypothetical protein RJB66_1064 [Pseudomonadota bacterium]|jgi:hypothetical protein
MKVISILMVMFASCLVSAANQSDLYYRIGRVTAIPVSSSIESTGQPVMDNCKPEDFSSKKGLGEDIDEVGVIIDKIVNVGKKVWGIIEMGRPVYNIKTDVAHALPAGIQCWATLEKWNAPRSQSWKVTYENQLGGKVVEFIYRVSYISGGQFKGLGRYITQATVDVAGLSVAWGYKVNIEGSVPTVFNMGTRENPVAGMQMNMKWTVDTVINHHEKNQQFYINGLGEMQQMQGREVFY